MLMQHPGANKIIENIYVKAIKGGDYYYTKVHTPYFTKEYYIGPYTTNKTLLKNNIERVYIRFFLDIAALIFKKYKQKNYTKGISAQSYFDIEFLRIGYNLFLKKLNKSDLQNYEEIVFTKYVYGSTNIEGNSYTLRETDLTLNEGITVAGKSTREFYEIENYAKLKHYLSQKKSIQINTSLIKKIHSFILKNIDDDARGEFRKVDVGIRGSNFAPLPSPFIEEEMQNLLRWHNQNKNNIHPIKLIALFHQKFEEIHPFIDGNGRVGREIMRLMLKKEGFPAIFIGPRNREEYLKALDQGNENNHVSLITFIISSLANANKNLLLEGMQNMLLALSKDQAFLKSNKDIQKQYIRIKKRLEEIKRET